MTTKSKLQYPVQSVESAPEAARTTLTNIKNMFGYIPNTIGVMANSPTALESYIRITGVFSKSEFSPLEQQQIFLAISVENDCVYCVAAHSTVLKNKFRSDADTIDSIRNQQPTGDNKLDALLNVVRQLVNNKGRVDKEVRDSFVSAGYTVNQFIDLLSAIAMKVLTNYLDHLAEIEIDDAYKGEIR